jgi:non-ribosomal peptide synthetase component F
VTGTLLNGAIFYIPDAKNVLPGNLIKTIRYENIIYVDLTPPFFNNSQFAPLLRLRIIVLAGAACGRQTIIMWGKGRTVVHTYGFTETTVCSCLCVYLNGAIKPEDSVFIGFLIFNTLMYVFNDDETKTPVKLWKIGKIYIGRLGVSEREYLNQTNFNDTAFLRNYLDRERFFRIGDLGKFFSGGEIEFVGRKDS